MNTKKWLLATVAGFAAVWFYGAFWHLIVFKSFFSGAEMLTVTRKDYLLPLIILGDIVWAGGLSYLYPLIKMNGSPAARGLKIGLVTGAMRGGIWALIVYGIYNIPTGAYIANAAGFSLTQGLLGGVAIALVYGRKF
jgi:hypothetical protein